MDKNSENMNLQDLTKEEQELLLQITLQVLAEAGELLIFNKIKDHVEKFIDELPIEE